VPVEADLGQFLVTVEEITYGQETDLADQVLVQVRALSRRTRSLDKLTPALDVGDLANRGNDVDPRQLQSDHDMLVLSVEGDLRFPR
jgi:hypothetical protein